MSRVELAIKVLEEVLNFTKDTETKQFVAKKIQELLEQNDLIKL